MTTPAAPGGYPGATHQQPVQQPVQQPGGFQQGYGDQSGPGVGERASHAANSVARHVKTPETKEFFKTSEFFVWALTTLGILIAAASVSEGDGADFAAREAWLYVALVSFAYIISRGISKAGTRRGYGDAPFDRGGSGGGAPFQGGSGY